MYFEVVLEGVIFSCNFFIVFSMGVNMFFRNIFFILIENNFRKSLNYLINNYKDKENRIKCI